MKNILFTALLVGACCCPLGAGAVAFEEVVVTGARFPVQAGRLPASVTVLDRADLEALQTRTLTEALGGVVGADMTAAGGYGALTGLSLRGTASDHVLTLVDGFRLGSATAGQTAFEHLPLSQVERIEIVRGPRAALWGADALGGVIHLFTRRGVGAEPRFRLDLGGGSYGTLDATAGVDGAYQDFDYSAAASYFDSRGIDARQPTPGPYGVDQPDRDGYNNISGRFRGGYQAGDAGRVEVFFLRAQGTSEYDGGFQDETDIVQQAAGGALSWRLPGNWRTQLRLGETRDETENFTPAGEFASRFDTRRRQLSWQNRVSWGADHALVFGVDHRRDKVVSSTQYARSAQNSTGLFAQYGLGVGGHHLLGAVRWDDDSAFGSKVTGGAGWSYVGIERMRWYVSYGAAYKTPSFNELFFPGFSNPDLGPEEAESWEIGLERQGNEVGWSVRAYHTRVRDLILSTAASDWIPYNIGKARITGIESEFTVGWRYWDLSLGIEYLDPKDRETGARLPRRSKRKMSFNLVRRLDRWSLGARLHAEGDRFDDAANQVEVAGFATVDLLGEYRINDQTTVRARLANLLDKDYQTVATYNSFDRNFFVSLHYQGG